MATRSVMHRQKYANKLPIPSLGMMLCYSYMELKQSINHACNLMR